MNEAGKTILLTTHYIEEAEHLCHRVGFVHQGHLVIVDAVQEILRRYGCGSLEAAFIEITGRPVEEMLI
jgi:ABC-type multidrug transport system ATPase subunit